MEMTLESGPIRRRVAPWLALLAALALGGLFAVLVLADPGTEKTADSPLLGELAPNATGELADGTPFELGRRRGSWVVLNFFTHNCVPCIAEHPELVRFAQQQRALGTDGAELYTIVRDSTRTEVERFFSERGGDWPIVYDPRFEFSNGFGVALVPETWVIDPMGFVRLRAIGTITADGLSQQISEMRSGSN